jgi:class 3 adenylate cyclase
MTVSPGGDSVQDQAGVILTPDQRVRVFISSTLEELAEERAAALRAIRRLHLVPVWFESGARPHPPQSMYRAYLEQSQIFVGIYWQRYGWVGPGMEISGLEDEFRLAAGMPMLLYLKRPAPEREPGLTAMIDAIRSAGTTSYRQFGTAGELERLLTDDLAVLLSESFADAAVGVRAPRSSPAEPVVPDAGELPAGTVTFLLTDIEGSTRLWEAEPEAMEVALQRHDRILAEVIESYGGVVITSRGEGDSFFAVFPSAVSAVEAAGMCQLRLGREVWPTGSALRVRMGLHTGEARVRGGDHLDHTPINRCARVRAAGHGGQVLLTRATSDLVADRLGSGFQLKELGEFRLRDLADPELIYQLTHPDLQVDFPPIQTVAERTGNLPLQLSSFIGRAGELEQTAAALGGARLVTLTGAGGVGKTRLALQIAEQVAAQFSDGAWLCELAPVRDPTGVDDAVAAVFAVTAPAGQSTSGALVEFLRGKQLLLVLDNCEHLLEAAAALADILHRSCKRLVILATSREGLGIEGETPAGATAADSRRRRRSGYHFGDGGGAPVRRPRGRGQTGFRGDRRECGGSHRRRVAAGRDSAGNRACRYTDSGNDSGRAGQAATAKFRSACCWAARRAGTSPDAAGHDRLVLPAACRARTGSTVPVGGVRRRLHPRSRRDDLRRERSRSRHGV